MPLSTTSCLPLCSSTWPKKNTPCANCSHTRFMTGFSMPAVQSLLPPVSSTWRYVFCPLVPGWVVSDHIMITLPHKSHSCSWGLWACCFLSLECSFPRYHHFWTVVLEKTLESPLDCLASSLQQVFTSMPSLQWDLFLLSAVSPPPSTRHTHMPSHTHDTSSSPSPC